MSIFGDLERLMADLYEYRVPITVGLVLAAGLALWFAYRMGWHLIVWRHKVASGLTAVVFLTKADFSFLRNFLWLGTIGAMGVIVAGWLFGFTLGIFFSGAMIILFSGWILYDTSNVLHHYHPNQYVGAALELFASVAMLFWYVLQLLMSLNGDD